MSRKTQLSLLLVMTAVMLLTTIPTATATTSAPYLVTVLVQLSPSGTAPSGISVQLTNLGTDQTCTGTSTTGGQVLFSAANNCPSLTAGWYRASLSPQKITFSSNNIWMVSPPNATGIDFAMGQPTGTATSVAISGVTMVPASSTISGSVTGPVQPGATYHIELLDPSFPGYVISSTNTTVPALIATGGSSRIADMVKASPSAGTLKLSFSVSSTCQISFNGNIYTNGGSASVSAGSTYPIEADACTGWNFNTWATSAGSLGAPKSNATVITLTNNGTLYANYTSTASYTLSDVPVGNWTLFTSGITSSQPGYDSYNYSSIYVSSPGMTIQNHDVKLQDYVISGILLTPTGTFSNATNVTIWDSSTHAAYLTHVPVPASGPSTYYQAGLYSQGVGASSGDQSFVAFIAPQGYSSAWDRVTVNNNAQNVRYDPVVAPLTSSYYNTTISFSNMSTANVTSHVNIGANGTFAQLPNASVGNLWAQIGFDFNHSMPGVNSASFNSFLTWLRSAGPVYPADSQGLAVNGTVFQDNGSYTFSTGSYSFPGNAYYYSPQGLSYETSRGYVLSPEVSANSVSYNLALGFNYPSSGESLNYTVNLPSGYVLRNGTAAPSGTTLVPSGPVGPSGNLWTSFTIIPHSHGSTHGMGNFTIYRVSNVTAVVNVTSSNFAFSVKNLLNQTRGSYSVIVGAGQNDSFTASHSLVPPTMNVTNYQWRFTNNPLAPCVNTSSWTYLKAQCVNTKATTIHHIYTTGGVFNGTLSLLASGGNRSTTPFEVFVDSVPPAPHISVNNTHVATLSAAESYLYVNWSTPLKLNATGTTDTIDPSVSANYQPGVLSVANWTIRAGSTHHWTNYTVGSGSKVLNNLTYQFNGAGGYVKNNVTLPGGHTLSLKGWEYSVALTVWDSGGNRANTTLYVLVNDTEKPVAVATVQNSNGHNITGGVVEQKNGTAEIRLLSNYSYDPHNGSLSKYSWSVTNAAGAEISACHTNKTQKCYWNATSSQAWTLYLQPSTDPYNFTLNVTDLVGNHGNASYPVTVAQNLTVRPIITVGNITAPGTMNDGTSYTVWIDVNNSGFKTAVAHNVSVLFYLTDASGNGKTVIGGSPNSVHWYGYEGSVVNSTYTYTGVLATLRANQSWRAEISFTPSITGTKWIWANATASNEFSGEYASKANVAHVAVTLNPNPLTTYLEYAAIAVAAIVVIVLVVFFWRRKTRGPTVSVKKDKDSKKLSKDEKKEDKKEEQE